METELLLLFIPTIIAVSVTPGMCMTLAFSMGLTQGYRRTLWMMIGEMVGVTIVVSITFFLLSWLRSLDPIYFNTLAILGALYLLWMARNLWTARDHFGRQQTPGKLSRPALLTLGLTTAIMNPKGWGFMIALLPGFIDDQRPMATQLATMLSVMLVSEFLSMSLYASGGSWLAKTLGDDQNLAILNKVAALLMVAVAALVFL